MTGALQPALQPLNCERDKFAAECISNSLFEGATRLLFKANEAVFLAGAPADGCYRLEQGLLKVSVAYSGSEERILAFLSPGTIVGELGMIDDEPRSASVFAVKDCELSFVSRRTFEERTGRHPQICQYLINVVAKRLRHIDQEMAADSFLTVQARLARALLELGKHVGENDDGGGLVIRHKISQTDLAAMTGLARETVNRVLSDWHRKQVVTRSTGFYCLSNIAALQTSMHLYKEPHRTVRENSLKPLKSWCRSAARTSLEYVLPCLSSVLLLC
jgi:CRP/FNR family transcriptional regulator, cyclic AMP receptor protein